MTKLPMGWMDCESELSGAQVEITNSMAQEKMTVALDGPNSHEQLGMTVFLRSAKISMEGQVLDRSWKELQSARPTGTCQKKLYYIYLPTHSGEDTCTIYGPKAYKPLGATMVDIDEDLMKIEALSRNRRELRAGRQGGSCSR